MANVTPELINEADNALRSFKNELAALEQEQAELLRQLGDKVKEEKEAQLRTQLNSL